MSGDSEKRIIEIARRVKRKRKIRENIIFAAVAFVCVNLFTGILTLLSSVKSHGAFSETDLCGSVLLTDGAVVYVVIGVAGFWLGAILTVICEKCRKNAYFARYGGKSRR